MTQESSTSSETESRSDFARWKEVVRGPDFLLLQQVLAAYRWQLVEKLVRAGSNHEEAAVARGAINMIDFVASGSLDEVAREMLGLSEETPTPPEGYMPKEEVFDG